MKKKANHTAPCKMVGDFNDDALDDVKSRNQSNSPRPMKIVLDSLPDKVQRFITNQLCQGNFDSAEELVQSMLERAADQEPVPQDSQQVDSSKRPSTRGILAHAGVDISLDDIEETSKDACKNFPRDFPEED